VPQIIPLEKMVKLGHLVALQAEMQPKLSGSFFNVTFVEKENAIECRMENS
jgi:hypothetical protein